MTKVLVLYYSSYGHVEILSQSIAVGAKSVEDVTVDIKRVPETLSMEVAKAAGVKIEKQLAFYQGHHVATIAKQIFGKS